MTGKSVYNRRELPEIVCESHPEWVGLYDRAWQIAFKNMEYPDREGWLPQMTCMPGAGILWQWDSCFMTLFSRYSNNTVSAMNNLDNLYRLQRDDGYMSMAYRIKTEEPAYGERINPPLFAWVEWEYFLVTGDDTRLERVLPRLVGLYDWIKNNRRRVNELYWFEDSGSSGMDNSPRSGYLSEDMDGSDVCFIDLACQQALSAICISKIARYLGRSETGSRFETEHEALKRIINDMHWCERTGFYFDVFARNEKGLHNNFLNHKTVAGFWPIISEIANERQVNRLIGHLSDPDEFMTPHLVPVLSKDDPNYEASGCYWRGSVWPPTNYMIVNGLKKRNRFFLAREIALKHVNSMIETARNENYDSIWECYSPEYMRPATREDGAVVRSDFVGWSGLGPIAMLIENILGFGFDAKNNRITWVIGTKGVHGIKNLRFNNKTVSLVCHCSSSVPGETKIEVETTGTINLRVLSMGKNQNLAMDFVLGDGRQEVFV